MRQQVPQEFIIYLNCYNLNEYLYFIHRLFKKKKKKTSSDIGKWIILTKKRTRKGEGGRKKIRIIIHGQRPSVYYKAYRILQEKILRYTYNLDKHPTYALRAYA